MISSNLITEHTITKRNYLFISFIYNYRNIKKAGSCMRVICYASVSDEKKCCSNTPVK